MEPSTDTLVCSKDDSGQHRRSVIRCYKKHEPWALTDTESRTSSAITARQLFHTSTKTSFRSVRVAKWSFQQHIKRQQFSTFDKIQSKQSKNVMIKQDDAEIGSASSELLLFYRRL